MLAAFRSSIHLAHTGPAMGSTYTNFVLRGPEQRRVAELLEERGRRAYVGPARQGCTIAFDAEADDDPGRNERLAAELSRELGCAALAFGVYDSDVCAYALCQGGEVVDRYDSAPGYWDGEDLPPQGGDAALLCRAIGGPQASPEAVERILRAPTDPDSYVFAEARHADLCDALGLPRYGVGLGYASIRQGDAETIQAELVRVGPEDEEEASPFAALFGEGGLGGLGDLSGLGGLGNLGELSGGGFPNLDLGDLAQQMSALTGMPSPIELMAMMGHPSVRFFNALAAGDAEEVRALFAGEPKIDDPRAGRVETAEALEALVAESARWLGEGAAAQREMLASLGMPELPAGLPFSLAYQPFAVTQSPGRDVAEGVLTVTSGGRPVQLPVATVWETAEGGGIGALRVYYTLWPVRGEHTVRPPLMPPAEGLEVPDVVGRYQAALAAGDVEGVVACFEPGGLAREPSGERYVHIGTEELRAFYTALFANGGGIPLQHCTVTDDGVRCAIEYVAVRWGRTELPPQAGIAVYERGPASGLLRAARIYDDVDPPLPPE